MQIKKYGMLLAAALALTAYTPGWTEAKTVVVDAAGNCTLPEAVSFIFDPGDGPGCVDSGGGPADTNTIILRTDVALQSTLKILADIAIEGQGHTVTGIPDNDVLSVEYSGKLTLNETTVTGGGAGISSDESRTIILNNSTVSGNTGGGIGGGMRGKIFLNNSTVSGNGGAGVATGRGSITLNNSTVSGNAVGISVYESGVTMHSSVVSGNSTYEIHERNVPSSWHLSFNVFGHSGKTNAEAFNISYSGMFAPASTDITATSDGTQQTTLAAILSPLADNGGLTQTHAVPAGSPAIDLDANCSASLARDQRGYARPVGDGCDAGSFEFGGIPAAPKNINMAPIYNLML